MPFLNEIVVYCHEPIVGRQFALGDTLIMHCEHGCICEDLITYLDALRVATNIDALPIITLEIYGCNMSDVAGGELYMSELMRRFNSVLFMSLLDFDCPVKSGRDMRENVSIIDIEALCVSYRYRNMPLVATGVTCNTLAINTNVKLVGLEGRNLKRLVINEARHASEETLLLHIGEAQQGAMHVDNVFIQLVECERVRCIEISGVIGTNYQVQRLRYDGFMETINNMQILETNR